MHNRLERHEITFSVLMTDSLVRLGDGVCLGALERQTLKRTHDDHIQRDFGLTWNTQNGLKMLGDFVIIKTTGEFGAGIVRAGVNSPRPLGYEISIGGFCKEVQPVIGD